MSYKCVESTATVKNYKNAMVKKVTAADCKKGKMRRVTMLS